MYDVVRKIHLYAGLVVLVFLMMYFASGYVLIHREWFGGQRGKPDPATATASIAGLASREPHAIAEHLNLHGRVTVPPKQPSDAVRFNVFRPGTTLQVEVPHAGDAARVTTVRENLAGVIVHLHRIHGYGGGPIWNTFVLFNDLASFSCILFALTGVYLWWKTAKRKALGFACLFASCAYTITMIL